MVPLIYSLKHGIVVFRNYSITPAFLFLTSRDEYIAPIPESERQDMILAYHAQLNSVDEETRIKAAKAWTKWELVFPSYQSAKLCVIIF